MTVLHKNMTEKARVAEARGILETLRVIREFEASAGDGYVPDDREFWTVIDECKDLFKCLLIIDDAQRLDALNDRRKGQ